MVPLFAKTDAVVLIDENIRILAKIMIHDLSKLNALSVFLLVFILPQVLYLKRWLEFNRRG